MRERPVASILPPMLAEQADRLSKLFEAHEDRLYRLARRLVPTADDALDLVQEAFLRAARSPGSIPHGLTNEEAWLVRVLVNVRRDQWRKEAVRKRHELERSHATARPDDPETAFLIRTTVWRALDYLPPRRRAVVVMYEIDGLAIASIASLLGINAITVRWHLSRGRRELARRLRLQLGETNEQPQKSLAGRRPAPSRTSAP
jgi:RNA polymerase sigma-70 factor (ECF subfamily)